MEVAFAPQNAAAPQVGPENEEELFRMQLTVAKRADELARKEAEARDAERDRKTWLLAEAEVLPTLSATVAG